ncbi:MAG: phage holin family protein [Bacteroidia bacterium]
MSEEEKTKIDDLIDHAEEYFKTRQELSKLVAAEKASIAVSSLVSGIVIFVIFFFVIVFASLALAHFISEYTGKAYIGYIAVMLLYLIAGLILNAKKEQWLETPVMNAFIKNFFKNDNDEQN